MDVIEHMKLHQRLRKENKCNIDKETLKKTSIKAYKITKKGIDYKKQYQKSDKYLAWRRKHRQQPHIQQSQRKYSQCNKAKLARKNYAKKAIRKKYFTKTLVKNVQLNEVITYNLSTDNISVTSGFRIL